MAAPALQDPSGGRAEFLLKQTRQDDARPRNCAFPLSLRRGKVGRHGQLAQRHDEQDLDTATALHGARAMSRDNIAFTKMHGLGNDFVVIDAVRQEVRLNRQQIRHIADRHFGVGCDQLLLVEPARSAEADFRYRIFNASGDEVEQCGNGARCFVRFVHDQGLSAKTELRVETLGGIIAPRLEADGEVTVDMGRPSFIPARVPFLAEHEAVVYPLQVGDETLALSVLSMGNPHAVQVVADVASAPVTTQGAAIESHARFPQRVNAGFMQVLTPRRIRLRVYERHVGETLACGTGACAAVVAGIRRGLLQRQVQVDTRGGTLHISWEADDAPVLMRGPAMRVFEGTLNLEDVA